MADVLQVKRREVKGTRRIRRLRDTGVVPAVLYGHGQENLPLVVPVEQISTTLRHGHRLVDLGGDVKEKAFIRQVQWNTYGTEVLHVDFFRVSEHDKIKTVVPLEFKGEAAGLKEGGVVEVVMHEVEIECPVAVLPDKLVLNISTLKLGGAIMAKDLELPQGARLLSTADVTLVHCVAPKSDEEELATPGAVVEPELIRKEKAADDEADEEKKK